MERQFAIRMEQAQSLHAAVPLVALGNLGGAMCAVLILYGEKALSTQFIAIWFALFFLHTLVSLVYRSKVSPASFAQPAQQARWFRWSVLDVGSLGVLWGSMCLPVLVQGDATYQLAILAGSAMLGAGAMASLGMHLPTYLAFVLTLLPPVSAVLLLQDNWLSIGMGMASSLFIFYMYSSGKRFNTSYIESLRLRFENLELVRELTLQKEAAEHAALAKSRFLAAASHDLRQPMYALNLYHGALEQCELSEEGRLTLANARQCAQAMDGMFAVLLDMSKLDAGAVKPVVCAFRVQDMLDRIRVEFAPLAQERGITLRVANCSAAIRSDTALAERIVRNLVANALRYTHSGTILVGCRPRGDRLRLQVIDTGIGIPEEKQEAIFEEYVQLGNPERDRSKGLGLGLAIVQRLSQLLDAPVSVRSQVGRGSCFAVDFPRAHAQDVEAAPHAVSRAADLKGRLIAVVDDEMMIRDAVKTVLEQWGCEVVVAGSGDEAVALLAMSPRPPDVIVCDYRLREGETGLDAIDKLRTEFCADIPALLVTGDTAPAQIQDIQKSDAQVLHKPLQPDALRAAIQSCIQPRNRS